jgi:hypothetical protein
LRNSNQSNSSQRRGQKNRRPSGKNDQRSGNGQRNSASNVNRNGQGSGGNQGSGSGQRNSSSQGRSRNEVSQAWASDTKTLSSHMPTVKKNEWGKKKSNSKNGSGTGSRGKNKPSNNKNRSGQSNRNQTRNKPHSRSNNDSTAQKTASTQRDSASSGSGKQVGNIDPFELFCAYHLGITKDKGYRTSNINEVANRFRSEPGMIKQALKEYDMDPESLLDRDFDMGLAQLDIQVAPEGVDRLELALGIYQDFKDAPRIKRDWNKILEEDRKENQKIFRN